MKPKNSLRSGLLPLATTFSFALGAPYAFSQTTTETFNTAGTTTWVCPNGVSTIQVECWGGGGAGGLGKGVGTGASQNAGGGGGGAYARKASVPVTPGFSYTITIPPAAVSGSGGQTGNGQFVNGGSVTFTGDSVTVTAAGGGGGRNIVVTTNSTNRAVGGPGGTTAASVGDVGGVFAGGAGAAGTFGALNNQDNSSGAGGGGAGNAAAGGNALAGTGTGSTPGAGGVAGGGAGGTGRIGANTNSGVGGPGATPGGGGGGGKNVGNTTQLGGNGGLGQITLTYTLPPNFKANNTDDLDESSSWTAFVPSGSVAKWDATVTGANTVSLGSDLSFAGIAITDPGGPVTINPGNLLTLGAAAVDIDLSAATQDLTLNNDLALGAANVWDVATGRTLTVGGVISGTPGITKQGAGTAVLGAGNIYTGLTSVADGTLTLAGNRTVVATSGVDVGSGGAPMATLDLQGDLPLAGTSFRIGISGPGTVTQTGGQTSFTGGNQLLVGNLTSDGIYNLSGGTLTTVNVANRGVMLGVNTGRSGTFNLSGTGVLNMGTTSVLHLGRAENSAANTTNGIFNQTGGTAIVGDLRIGGSTAGSANNANTTGTLNLSAGTFSAATFSQLSGGNNSVSTINIGGTADVTLPAFPTGRGSTTTSTINFDGGTLKPLAASAAYMGGLTNAFIKAGGAKLDTTNGSITISQALLTDPVSTGGGLIKDGANTLTLTGANTYTGPTLVNAGQLGIAGGGALSGTGNVSVATGAAFSYLPTTVGSTLTLVAGSTLNLADASTLGLSWDATTASKIAVAGAATVGNNVLLNLTGTYTSETSYTLLTAASGLDTGSYGFLNVSDATIGVVKTPTSVTVVPTSTAPLGAAYWTGTATAGLTKVWAASDAGLDSNWAATAGGTAQGLVPGSGADVFISANTVTAAPTNTILGANMSIKSLTVTDTSNGLSLNPDGNTLTITPAVSTSGITIAASVPASSIGANLVLGADQTWTNDSASPLGISGNVSGSSGLTKAGTGTIALGGGFSITGPVAINAGTLSLSPAGTLTLTNTLSGSGTLSANPGNANFSLNGDLSGFTGTINVAAPLASPGKVVTGASSPLGTGAVVDIASGGTWFTNNATQTGITINLSGIGNAEGFGAFRTDNGTVDATSAIVLQSDSWIGGITNTNVATIRAVISENVGPFGITKVGVNTMALEAANTYSGLTTVNAGALRLQGSGTPGNTAQGTVVNGTATGNANNARVELAGGITVSGESLVIQGVGTFFGALTSTSGNNEWAGSVTIAPTGAGITRLGASANANLTVSGVIDSGLVDTGLIIRSTNITDSTVILSGANTYIGKTDVAVGKLQLAGGDNRLPVATTVTMGATTNVGELDLNGTNQEVAGLAINLGATAANNALNNSSATLSTLTVNTAATFPSAFPGIVKGNLALAKAGADSLTLSAANSFTGDITVTGGTLVAAGATNGSGGVSVLGSRVNTRTIAVNNGGVLRFDSGNILGANHVATTAPTLVINSGGVVTNGGIATNNALNDIQLNDGTLTSTTGHTGSTPPNLPVYGAWNLNGAVTSTGSSTISTSDPTKGWVMLKVVGDKTTDFNVVNGTLTVSAPVVDNPTDSNIGSLSKSGTGSMVLSGINTYTGNTVVNDGSLELADNARLKFALGAASGVTNSLTGAGTVTLAGDFVIDTTAADALSSGTWTLENVATLTGPYEATFTVVGFTDAGDNQWTKTVAGKTYTFDETTGILTLGGGYSSWAAVNAPSGTSADDFDGDGVSNAVEYVLGGDKDTNDLGKLPVLSTTGGNLVFSFKRDQESIDGTTTVAIQVGTTLGDWPLSYAVGADTAGSAPEVTVAKDAPATGTDTVTLTIPQAPDLKKFARLNVTVTP
jgi:fibronectin-binding autotransporter adhesin